MNRRKFLGILGAAALAMGIALPEPELKIIIPRERPSPDLELFIQNLTRDISDSWGISPELMRELAKLPS